MMFDIKKFLNENKIVLEAKVRQTDYHPKESQAHGEAKRMGFEKNGYYVMETPLGWVAIEYEHPQYFGPDEGVSEGMMGYGRALDSDRAADYLAELEDLFKWHGDNKPKLKTGFEKWLKKIVRDTADYGVDQTGPRSLALITKEPVFKEVLRLTKLNIKPYIKQALKEVERDSVEYKKDRESEPDFIRAIRSYINQLRKFV